MDKNIALILALSLNPSTIFMFCIHYSSPVPRAPFPVLHILRTKRSQSSYCANVGATAKEMK